MPRLCEVVNILWQISQVRLGLRASTSKTSDAGTDIKVAMNTASYYWLFTFFLWQFNGQSRQPEQMVINIAVAMTIMI